MEQQQWYVAAPTEREQMASAAPASQRPTDRRDGSGGWYPWRQNADQAAEEPMMAAEEVSDLPAPSTDGEWFQRSRLEATKQLAN